MIKLILPLIHYYDNLILKKLIKQHKKNQNKIMIKALSYIEEEKDLRVKNALVNWASSPHLIPASISNGIETITYNKIKCSCPGCKKTLQNDLVRGNLIQHDKATVEYDYMALCIDCGVMFPVQTIHQIEKDSEVNIANIVDGKWVSNPAYDQPVKTRRD